MVVICLEHCKAAVLAHHTLLACCRGGRMRNESLPNHCKTHLGRWCNQRVRIHERCTERVGTSSRNSTAHGECLSMGKLCRI